MSRLTKYFADRDEYGHNSCHGGCESCTGVLCGDAFEMIKKLAHYEDLEDQLEKLYGGKLSLDDIVDNLNRIVQNGEEKLDYARILTNSEAEKWDYWKALEEQGLLVELPCKVGDTVWYIEEMKSYTPLYHSWYECLSFRIGYIEIAEKWLAFGRDGSGMFTDIRFHGKDIGKTVFLTKEEAEAKLAELKGTEE